MPFSACSEDEVVLTALAIAYAKLNHEGLTKQDELHIEELVDGALCETVAWGPKIEIKPAEGWHVTVWATIIP